MSKSKPKSAPSEQAERVAERLHATAIHLLRRVRRRDTASRAGPAQLSALSVLVFGGPVTLGQLAAAEQVKAPTMTRIVAGLRRSGWVRLIPDPADARRVQVYPTPSGVGVLEQARKRRIGYLARGLARLKAKQLAVVGEAVEVLDDAMMGWE
ncbi:MAG TPA: MarR family transcriptional regulator [Terriglobales bacterium]|nr:MarR family transcriptional regulator [Terriglobales bacterium]